MDRKDILVKDPAVRIILGKRKKIEK